MRLLQARTARAPARETLAATCGQSLCGNQYTSCRHLHTSGGAHSRHITYELLSRDSINIVATPALPGVCRFHRCSQTRHAAICMRSCSNFSGVSITPRIVSSTSLVRLNLTHHLVYPGIRNMAVSARSLHTTPGSCNAQVWIYSS